MIARGRPRGGRPSATKKCLGKARTPQAGGIKHPHPGDAAQIRRTAMTGPKRSPEKVRRPFFRRPFFWWKRLSASEAVKPALVSETDTEVLKRPWYRSPVLKIAGAALCVLLIIPKHAHEPLG